MKGLKKWLLPVLTAVIVVAAAVLPPRLSQMGDRSILNVVHVEALPEDSGVIPTTAAMPEKIALLTEYEADTGLVLSSRKLVSLEEVEGTVFDVLQELQEMGILSESFQAEKLDAFSAERVYIRDTQKNTGAVFLLFEAVQSDFFLSAALDEESGSVLRFREEYSGKQLPAATQGVEDGTGADEAVAAGVAFLNRLGLDCGYIAGGKREAIFSIEGENLQYLVELEDTFVQICPQQYWQYPVDEETLDSSRTVVK